MERKEQGRSGVGKRVQTHSAPTFKGRCSINLGQRSRRVYLVLFLSSGDIVVPPSRQVYIYIYSRQESPSLWSLYSTGEQIGDVKIVN